MATTTPILGLVKPAGSDFVDISVLNSNSDKLDTAYGSLLITGIVLPFAGTTAPNGWLMADGAAVSRTTYAALFAVVGTTYGSGNGSTTFNLPDLRGRVPVGKNTGTFATLGATGGAETVALTEAQLPSHTHANSLNNNVVASSSHTHGSSSLIARWFNLFYQNRTGSTWTATNAHNASITGGSTSSTADGIAIGGNTDSPSATTTVDITNAAIGSGQGHANLQPYQVLNYCIKY